MLVLSANDVRESLPMGDAIQAMKRAFAALSRGDATVPLRAHLPTPNGDGITLVMPARVDGESEALAVKIVSVFDGNPGLGIARIHAAVIAFEPGTGRPVALLEGSSLTAIRTAAASGAATDLVAKPGAASLAVFGAGVQARSHIEAMCAVRPIRSIRVFDTEPRKVEELIDDSGRPGVDISRADSPGDAVRGADIVCTTTTSATPVFDDADIAPGAHINAVGAYTPQTREIGGDTVAQAWVFVDDRDAAWEEAGDLIQPRQAGLIGADHVRADLGELVLDPALRPTDPTQVTLFKTVGVAVQDAVAASVVLDTARRRGLGTTVAWQA
jgi:ornithine cyclodeaminase/alanine dehydrogenase-like protein (mu-crystallin family)